METNENTPYDSNYFAPYFINVIQIPQLTAIELAQTINESLLKLDKHLTEKFLPDETDKEEGMKSCDPQIWIAPQDAIKAFQEGILTKEEARKLLGIKDSPKENSTD